MYRDRDLERPSLPEKFKFVSFIILVILIVIGGITALTSFYSINTSYAGIIIDPLSNQLYGPVIGPKWGFKAPWQSIVSQPYTVNFLTMSSDSGSDYPPLEAFTTDRIEVLISLTIRYEVDPNKIIQLYRNYPQWNFEFSTMHSIAQQIIKSDTKDYAWMDYSTKRDEIASKIQSDLRNAFTNEPTFAGAITNIEFNLNNVKYPDALINELEKTTAAQQSIITAMNERQATLINANATAQKLIIQAEGQARAIEIIKAEFGDQWPLYYTMSQLNSIAENGGVVIWSSGEAPNVVLPQPKP